MPRVSKTAAAAVVTLPLEDAEQLYELFKAVQEADAHFHTCQAVNFRDFVKTVYRAQRVSAAFAGLKAQIDQTKGE